MKKTIVVLLSAVLLCSLLPAVHAREYGKIRALCERAAYVAKQKNDFVVRVLTSYKILHEVNEQGAVIRLYMEDKWMDITAVEIVPVLQETSDNTRRVTAHELYFFTADGILDVISELTIR